MRRGVPLPRERSEWRGLGVGAPVAPSRLQVRLSRIPSKRGPRTPRPAAPQRRSTYFEAVAVYERGLEALQRHDYDGAGSLFESVLRLYPEEKELHERVRLYLNICQRQAKPRESSPQTVDERLYAATPQTNPLTS